MGGSSSCSSSLQAQQGAAIAGKRVHQQALQRDSKAVNMGRVGNS